MKKVRQGLEGTSVKIDFVRQEFFDLVGGLGAGEFGEQATHIGVRFQTIAPGRLQDAVNHGGSLRASDRVGEKPVLSSDGKRPDPVLDKIVVNGQPAVFKITEQVWPLISRIPDGLADQPLRRMPVLV